MASTRPTLSPETRALATGIRSFLDSCPPDRQRVLTRDVATQAARRTSAELWHADLAEIASKKVGDTMSAPLDAMTLMAACEVFMRFRRTASDADCATFAAAIHGAAVTISAQLVHEAGRS